MLARRKIFVACMRVSKVFFALTRLSLPRGYPGAWCLDWYGSTILIIVEVSRSTPLATSLLFMAWTKPPSPGLYSVPRVEIVAALLGVTTHSIVCACSARGSSIPTTAITPAPMGLWRKMRPVKQRMVCGVGLASSALDEAAAPRRSQNVCAEHVDEMSMRALGTG